MPVSRTGISDSERNELITAAQLTQNDTQALANLGTLNVRLSSTMDRNKDRDMRVILI